MSSRPPLTDALRDLRSEVGSGKQGMEAEAAWAGFLRFGRWRYDAAETPDADGLLFQYGTFSFDGPPEFLLDFTRQFEINDVDGEHDHYVQVHCELHYADEPVLREVGKFNSWFFHDGGEDLDQWSGAVRDHAVWEVVRDRMPSEIRISMEDI
jgi:hypothetical protein